MTKGERKLCDFWYCKTGGFYTHLFEAIFRADAEKLILLERGFPEEVAAYRCYSSIGGYWDELRNEYNNTKWGDEVPIVIKSDG